MLILKMEIRCSVQLILVSLIPLQSAVSEQCWVYNSIYLYQELVYLGLEPMKPRLVVFPALPVSDPLFASVSLCRLFHHLWLEGAGFWVKPQLWGVEQGTQYPSTRAQCTGHGWLQTLQTSSCFPSRHLNQGFRTVGSKHWKGSLAN